MLKHVRRALQLAAAAALLVCPATAGASSHMDAPLITLDDAANTTDVYAFVSYKDGVKYLTTALAVYPHEEPGIGPNKYNFDDDVLYEIRVATGDDAQEGPHDLRLSVPIRHEVPESRHHPAVVPRRDRQRGRWGAEPDPALHRHQGRLPHGCHHTARKRHRPTQQSGDRDAQVQPQQRRRPARQGRRGRRGRPRRLHGAVDRGPQGRLQRLRRSAGRRVLCRHPGGLRSPEAAGAWQGRGLPGRVQRPHHGAQDPAGRDRRRSADRRRLRDHQPSNASGFSRPFGDANQGDWVQVARQGNPLFNEGLVSIRDKDLYSRTSPEFDAVPVPASTP